MHPLGPVMLDALAVLGEHYPQCSSDEYVTAIHGCKDILHRHVLVRALLRVHAHELIATYDRDPTPAHRWAAVEAMTSALDGPPTPNDDEAVSEEMARMLPHFPSKIAPQELVELLASSAVRERVLGETLGQSLHRICRDDVALHWAHETVVNR